MKTKFCILLHYIHSSRSYSIVHVFVYITYIVVEVIVLYLCLSVGNPRVPPSEEVHITQGDLNKYVSLFM